MLSPKITVIVTTYNWPEALAMVLNSLLAQVDAHCEIIVADDGSGQKTRDLLSTYADKVIHIWQEDQGFRAARIRNKAIRAASGDYIIFLDGDSIPQHNFITRYRELLKPGYFLVGNRALLSASFTAEVLQSKLDLTSISLLTWLTWSLSGKVNRIIPLISCPWHNWRYRCKGRWQGAKTCNLGVWKNDLERINGFEEQFIGWGYEDSDLVLRLLRAGLSRCEGRWYLPIIHLWHQERKLGQEHNLERFKMRMESNIVKAELGLAQV